MLKFISYFQLFLHNFFTFYPKNPKRPKHQSDNMAHFVAFCTGFQKNIPLQNPPWGGVGVYGSTRSSRRDPVYGNNEHYDCWCENVPGSSRHYES